MMHRALSVEGLVCVLKSCRPKQLCCPTIKNHVITLLLCLDIHRVILSCWSLMGWDLEMYQLCVALYVRILT
jgi:hypothetical protein